MFVFFISVHTQDNCVRSFPERTSFCTTHLTSSSKKISDDVNITQLYTCATCFTLNLTARDEKICCFYCSSQPGRWLPASRFRAATTTLALGRKVTILSTLAQNDVKNEENRSYTSNFKNYKTYPNQKIG